MLTESQARRKTNCIPDVWDNLDNLGLDKPGLRYFIWKLQKTKNNKKKHAWYHLYNDPIFVKMEGKFSKCIHCKTVEKGGKG